MNKQYVSEIKGQVILSLHVFGRKSFLQQPGCAKTTFEGMGFVQGSDVLLNFLVQPVMLGIPMLAISV